MLETHTEAIIEESQVLDIRLYSGDTAPHWDKQRPPIRGVKRGSQVGAN